MSFTKHCDSGSAAGVFDDIPFALQFLHELVPMVALDLNDVVFDGSAGAAFAFQFFRKRFHLGYRQRQAGDGGHAFPFASLCLAAEADDAVRNRD